MPEPEVLLGAVEGARMYFVLDWFRGNWQLSLHPDVDWAACKLTHELGSILNELSTIVIRFLCS